MILIYTVNLGNYDTVKPALPEIGVKYILFTDDKKYKVNGWDSVYIKPKTDKLRQSREIKINVHKFIKEDFDFYIYIDANYTILKSLFTYAKRYYTGGFLAHKHPSRNCLFDESTRVIEKNIDHKDVIIPQIRRYIAAGMPKRFGLTENGFFIRDSSLNDFCEKWYDEVEKGSYRDQISLAYCVFKYKPRINAMNNNYFNGYLQLRPHIGLRDLGNVPKAVSAPKVWYFTPGRGDKDLGSAYNDCCELVPDNDWICLMDGDVMFLNPFWSKQIEDIISLHGYKYPLISCVTNRLGLEWQLPFGFSEDPDILNHAKIADDLFDKKYSEVIPSPQPTAGLFMLFPKTTWNRVKFKPGLASETIFVDWDFSSRVMENIGKIGIATGLYLFHFYRLNRKSKKDIQHLL